MKEIKRKHELVKIIEKYFTEDNDAEIDLSDVFYYAYAHCQNRSRNSQTEIANNSWKELGEILLKTTKELAKFYRS